MMNGSGKKRIQRKEGGAEGQNALVRLLGKPGLDLREHHHVLNELRGIPDLFPINYKQIPVRAASFRSTLLDSGVSFSQASGKLARSSITGRGCDGPTRRWRPPSVDVGWVPDPLDCFLA